MSRGDHTRQQAGGSQHGMLLRGRLTLLLLAVVLLAVIDWILPFQRPLSPAARDPEAGSAALQLAPAEIYRDIPLTRERVRALVAATPASAVELPNLVELVPPPPRRPDLRAPLRIDYTLARDLTEEVFAILKRGRVELGHAIVLDPATGRVLVYASTDADRFPPDRAYPAASLVKVITAAAALHQDPDVKDQKCRYIGNPYRLTPSRVNPPRSGNSVSLRRALATSNNQCFAQLAVHRVGRRNLLGAIDRFGWLSPPAPVHPSGRVEAEEDPFDLGRLGSGLGGSRITPLHAAQLAATLAHGKRVEPRWVERATDGVGRTLRVADQPPSRVLTVSLAEELREMLVDTTERGTARRAFRTRRGPLLAPVRVAGKTGSLSGRDPDGRYEWFIGVAPADVPRIAVAVVVVHGDRWWVTPAQVAAEILKVVFCPKGVCRPEAAERWLRRPPTPPARASSQGAERLPPS